MGPVAGLPYPNQMLSIMNWRFRAWAMAWRTRLSLRSSRSVLSRSSETGENISWPFVVTIRSGFAASLLASLKGTAPMAAKWASPFSSAAVRVEESRMKRATMRSRYGRPSFQ